jgi:hypothetical protein
MAMIEIQNVPDDVVELLATKVFRRPDLRSSFDESLRAALVNELRRRKGSAQADGVRLQAIFQQNRSTAFLVMIPPLRPFESLAASWELVGKSFDAQQEAVASFAMGDRQQYEGFIGCSQFLKAVAEKLHEQTYRACAREKRKWN